MSRLEGKFDAPGDGPVDAAEILAALARECSLSEERRRDAVRRYLAGGEGWREASGLLDGAFAGNSGARAEDTEE